MAEARIGRVRCLEIWGDFACFSRPEMKVERYSYPVITPSAARGVFDAILWKPGVRWQPIRVELLEPPCYIALRRNEVKDKGPSERAILNWMSGRAEPTPIFADADSDWLGTDVGGRTQRQTMALKRVRYRVQAHLVSLPSGRDDLKALDQQFARRTRRGQCVWQPCLGCREFPAYFRLIEDGEPASAPVPLNLDIGWMVYDVFDLSRVNGDDALPAVSLFRARIDRGVLDIPDYHSAAVVKPQHL